MSLMEIYGGVSLTLLALSAVTGVLYFSKRIGNKAKLRSLRRTRPIRKISELEMAALRPFLINSAELVLKVKLLSDGVFPLKGIATAYGVKGPHGAETHEAIGGANVILPYDAAEYIESENDAEVAITNFGAIVLRLNSRFDLVTAGTVFNGGGDELQIGHQTGYELIGERDAESAEAAYELDRDNTKLMLKQLLSGFALLVASSYFGGYVSLILALASASLVAASAVLAWFDFPLRKYRIQRLSGVLALATVSNARTTGFRPSRYNLGGTLSLRYPQHWEKELDQLANEIVDIDVCGQRNFLVRVGSQLSVPKEEALAPRRHEIRHGMLSVFGLLIAMLSDIFGLDSWTRASTAIVQAALPAASDFNVSGVQVVVGAALCLGHGAWLLWLVIFGEDREFQIKKQLEAGVPANAADNDVDSNKAAASD